MIVTQDNQRMYLRNSEYNLARVLSDLAKIVIQNGGRVKSNHCAVISNFSIDDAIREYSGKIARLEQAIVDHGENDLRAAALKGYKQELAELQAIDNTPITVEHCSYISFILGDSHYYYQVDDNPFFPFFYSKAAIKNGKYSGDASSDEDKKDWLYDCFFKSECSEKDVHNAAKYLYHMLTSAKNTPIMRGKKRQRVENTFNDGYHWEMVYNPERICSIDF